MTPRAQDPADLTPDDRARELAAVLAVGLLRLLRPVQVPENLTESRPNELAVCGDKSVTVHAG